MEELKFCEVVDLIRKEDPRYERRAYFFLRDALDHTVSAVRKSESKTGMRRPTRHVSGTELLEGIRDYALQQFGPMAHFVLTQWGVKRCGDFGEMVYQLIDYGVFSKTEEDRREHFVELYDFHEVFVQPFQPRRPAVPESKVASSESS